MPGEPTSYEASIEYIRQQFLATNENVKQRIVGFMLAHRTRAHEMISSWSDDIRWTQIYAHNTCATDTGQVEHVLTAVIETVLTINMKNTGMQT